MGYTMPTMITTEWLNQIAGLDVDDEAFAPAYNARWLIHYVAPPAARPEPGRFFVPFPTISILPPDSSRTTFLDSLLVHYPARAFVPAKRLTARFLDGRLWTLRPSFVVPPRPEESARHAEPPGAAGVNPIMLEAA